MKLSLIYEGLATILAMVAVFVFSAYVASAIGMPGVRPTERDALELTAHTAVTLIVISPLLETPFVMMFMRSGVETWLLRAALCGAIIGALHILLFGLAAAGSVIVFFANALIYAWWKRRLNVGWGALAAFAAHALHNAAAVFAPVSFWNHVARFAA